MKPDHKAALYTAENCQDIPEYQNNLAVAYLDLREKAKAVHAARIAQEYASRENWLASTESFIATLDALREILDET